MPDETAAAPDPDLGEFLFRVNCRVERYSGCLVGALIVGGVVGTGLLGLLVFETVRERWVTTLVVFAGLAFTFGMSFSLWRMERSVLRLHENGFQLVRGEFVDDELLLSDISTWSKHERWLHLHLEEVGWLRLRLGPVALEDLSDYLEERLDP